MSRSTTNPPIAADGSQDKMKLRRETGGESWDAGRFLHPHDACFDADGNIFVAEWVHSGRITKLRKLD